MEVVLTPDTKTQISLRLQWREGRWKCRRGVISVITHR